jgi:hypothetical protein
MSLKLEVKDGKLVLTAYDCASMALSREAWDWVVLTVPLFTSGERRDIPSESLVDE